MRLQLQISAMERIYHTRKKLKEAQLELIEANKALLHLSMFDKLTGLANRRNFDDTLEKEYKLAKREKNPLTVIICDIDFLKFIMTPMGTKLGMTVLSP